MAIGGDGVRCLIPGLPNEVGILCLAKVPLSCRHAMRVVCTSWRDVFNDNNYWAGKPSETLVLFGAPNSCERHVWHCLHQSTKVWTRLPPMPEDFEVPASSASAVIGEKLFIIGGWCRRDLEDGRIVASSTVFYFDMRSYKWVRTASLNEVRAQGLAGVINNRIYMCGGITGYLRGGRGKIWTSTAEVYDLTSETWTRIASMDSPQVVQFCTVIDEELHITYNGGRDGSKYDPRNDKWSNISQELSRSLQGVPVIFQGEIYLLIGSEFRAGAPHTIDIITYNTEEDRSDVFRVTEMMSHFPKGKNF